MRRRKWAGAGGLFRARAAPAIACVAGAGLLAFVVRCTSSSGVGGDPCNPDENGVSGGTSVLSATVSDTEFDVGSPDSGERNITVENSATVVLTLTNVGTKPHDLVIGCAPTPNTEGCPMQECFAADAGIAPLAPGASATTTIMTPAHEATYPFYSDLPGDTQVGPDGGLTGLVGAFDLM